mgnify:FL=1
MTSKTTFIPAGKSIELDSLLLDLALAYIRERHPLFHWKVRSQFYIEAGIKTLILYDTTGAIYSSFRVEDIITRPDDPGLWRVWPIITKACADQAIAESLGYE